MHSLLRVGAALAVAASAAGAQADTELVIATVNNGHMIEMQKLSARFEQAHPASRSNGSRWKRACCASA
jgi:sorbitol/mannitol transport system substrate-binding protein